jgi:hypothetical protein
VLPFTGLSFPLGVTVDAAGTVYVTDEKTIGCSSCRPGQVPSKCCPSPASVPRSV